MHAELEFAGEIGNSPDRFVRRLKISRQGTNRDRRNE